jgi:hypothetical protein
MGAGPSLSLVGIDGADVATAKLEASTVGFEEAADERVREARTKSTAAKVRNDFIFLS